MKIIDVIDEVNNLYKEDFDLSKSRDKVLFGKMHLQCDCSGVIFTLNATIDVIQKAIKEKANLIIVHEALFYNHGDHTEFLKDNRTFSKKIELLEMNKIVVYRNHDHIHSGILINGQYEDGIVYGVLSKLDWIKYVKMGTSVPTIFEIPSMRLDDLAKYVIKKLELNGARLIGNPNTVIKKIMFFNHVWGIENDNQIINTIEEYDIDLLIPGEIVDFTVSEYIKDSSIAFNSKAILSIGHFNLEEFGMEYIIEQLPLKIKEELNCIYIKSGDMYNYITNQ